MPFDTKIQVSNVVLSPEGPHWLAQGAGNLFAGTPFDRPWFIFRNTGFKAGLKGPYYGAPFGPSGGAAIITMATTGAGNVPSGTVVNVREVYKRPTTGERSNGGKVFTFTVGASNAKVTFTSNSIALSGETDIYFREFYVEYVDLSGGYFLGATATYTGGADVSITLDMTPELLQEQRPLESALENSVFPAVASMCYWKGRMWGGGQRSRYPMDSAIEFVNGSDQARMTGYNQFKDGDTYKAIKYVGPDATIAGIGVFFGLIMGYVDTVLSTTRAIIRWEPWVGSVDGTTWPRASFTMTNPATGSGDPTFAMYAVADADVYCSPAYLGEAADGITYGILSWSPLNVIRDDILWQTCGRVQFVARGGEDLVIVYERGATICYGDFSLDQPPKIRTFPISHEVGTFNPHTVWMDGDRRLWFIGYGRVYTVEGNRITEQSRSMGIAGWMADNVSNDLGQMEDAAVSYNTSRNATLMVGMTKEGDAAQGRWGAYICHDRVPNTLHPQRFPVRFTSSVAVPAEIKGQQFRQWYSGTDDGDIYLVMPPGLNEDFVGAADVTGSEISWFSRTGIRIRGWFAVIKSLFLSFRGGADGLQISVVTETCGTNDLSRVTSTTTTLNRDQLSQEFSDIDRVGSVHAVRLKVSGTNNRGRLVLHSATVRFDEQLDRSG